MARKFTPPPSHGTRSTDRRGILDVSMFSPSSAGLGNLTGKSCTDDNIQKQGEILPAPVERRRGQCLKSHVQQWSEKAGGVVQNEYQEKLLRCLECFSFMLSGRISGTTVEGAYPLRCIFLWTGSNSRSSRSLSVSSIVLIFTALVKSTSTSPLRVWLAFFVISEAYRCTSTPACRPMLRWCLPWDLGRTATSPMCSVITFPLQVGGFGRVFLAFIL